MSKKSSLNVSNDVTLYMITVLLILYIVLLNIPNDTFPFNLIFNRNRTTSSEDHGKTPYCVASNPAYGTYSDSQVMAIG